MINLNDIKFIKVLSDKSVFGIVWKAIYKKQLCAVKVLILKSGVHYNTRQRHFVSPKIHKISAHKIPSHKIPKTEYLLDKYYQRKAVTAVAFKKEIDSLTRAHKFGYGVKYHGYSLHQVNLDDNLHIISGFIVMDLTDGDLSDVIRKRPLTRTEEILVNVTINRMHQRSVHGDLKPANIGIYYDQFRQLNKIVIFDCDKMINREDISVDEFKKLRQNDNQKYTTRYQQLLARVKHYNINPSQKKYK